jgi:hypothetical protein
VCRGHHHLVAALNDAILLRSIRREVVELDALVGAVCGKLSRCELAGVVHSQNSQLAAALLCSSLGALDGVHRGCLGVEQHGPHEP